MKIKILGPVLLLMLATRFASAAAADGGAANESDNKNILNANLAATPAAAASSAADDATKVDIALAQAQLARAMEFVADELVEDEAGDENYDDEDDGQDEDQDYDNEDDDGDEDEDVDEEQEEALEGDFHYADPLTYTYEEQTAQCQQHKQTQPEHQPIKHEKRDTISDASVSKDDPILSAEATAESGRACIDFFVNFALRFRERCSIKCLKTFTPIFSSPNVLGALDCFGCTNFFVSGFYAVGVDCAGLFVAYPKPPNATVPTTTGTATATGTATKTGVPPSGTTKTTKAVDGVEYRLGQVQPEDSALPAIDLAAMLKSLGQINPNDIQDWFDIGSDLVKVASPDSTTTSRSEEGSSERDSSSNKEAASEEKAAAIKDLFNKFVSKAASFANWIITPEALDQTGVYDRVQSLGIL
ncbi:hypothetical protein BGX23_012543 [Mortierella sp. AD031]|nr:hypothetical protein BGX23_012543 [Mortierella sp. AD031]